MTTDSNGGNSANRDVGDEDEVAACWVDGVARVEPWAWFLACRRARVLSQRELAAAAGLPQSTITRIEGGLSRPGYDTVARVLAATGYELVAVDGLGQILPTDDVAIGVLAIGVLAIARAPVADPSRPAPHAALLRTPARRLHALRLAAVVGWHSIAWHDDDPVVPRWTYHKRWRAR